MSGVYTHLSVGTPTSHCGRPRCGNSQAHFIYTRLLLIANKWFAESAAIRDKRVTKRGLAVALRGEILCLVLAPARSCSEKIGFQLLFRWPFFFPKWNPKPSLRKRCGRSSCLTNTHTSCYFQNSLSLDINHQRRRWMKC